MHLGTHAAAVAVGVTSGTRDLEGGGLGGGGLLSFLPASCVLVDPGSMSDVLL